MFKYKNLIKMGLDTLKNKKSGQYYQCLGALGLEAEKYLEFQEEENLKDCLKEIEETLRQNKYFINPTLFKVLKNLDNLENIKIPEKPKKLDKPKFEPKTKFFATVEEHYMQDVRDIARKYGKHYTQVRTGKYLFEDQMISIHEVELLMRFVNYAVSEGKTAKDYFRDPKKDFRPSHLLREMASLYAHENTGYTRRFSGGSPEIYRREREKVKIFFGLSDRF